jgi:hypothetical protein
VIQTVSDCVSAYAGRLVEYCSDMARAHIVPLSVQPTALVSAAATVAMKARPLRNVSMGRRTCKRAAFLPH